jgi:hypothetical protein
LVDIKQIARPVRARNVAIIASAVF